MRAAIAAFSMSLAAASPSPAQTGADWFPVPAGAVYQTGDSWTDRGSTYRLYGVQSCLRGTSFTNAHGVGRDCGEASLAMLVALRTDGIAREDSLAENTMREALHPLDQFRAFQALRTEHELGDEEIAARFFVTPAVVRQRLKLAAASPKLLDLYAAGELSLEQLMAFCVTGDHVRQEQVWEGLSRSYSREPYAIRRLLIEQVVKAGDRRAVFVGAEWYEAAGGTIARDLFQQDHGGWFEDVALLDRLVRERLQAEAETVRSEGWMWVEAAPDFPYGHTSGLRPVASTEAALSEADQTEHERLRAEFDALEAEHAGSSEDLSEEVDARLAELEAALPGFEDRPRIYDPAEIARAGAFVSVDHSGALKVERGFVRPQDETASVDPDADQRDGSASDVDDGREMPVAAGSQPSAQDTPEEEDGIRPLPERLLTELTAHRTLAIRDAFAGDPDTAYLAVLHALALKAFYRFGTESCLEIETKNTGFTVQAPGLADTASARSISARHQAWGQQLPQAPEALWDALAGFERDSREALFAHCAALSVNAVHESWNRAPGRIRHADQLAGALRLDMAEAGWTPTAGNYLGRVTKARILVAVREAKGDGSVQLINHLKKADMASEAERLLAGTGWLPEPLRSPGLDAPALPFTSARDSMTEEGAEAEHEGLPAFLAGDEAEAEQEHFIAAE